MKKSNVILVIYNILIALFIIIIDWNDWGGIVYFPILFILVLFVTPILTLILYRKSENKGAITLKSYFTTIILSTVLYLFKTMG